MACFFFFFWRSKVEIDIICGLFATIRDGEDRFERMVVPQLISFPFLLEFLQTFSNYRTLVQVLKTKRLIHTQLITSTFIINAVGYDSLGSAFNL